MDKVYTALGFEGIGKAFMRLKKFPMTFRAFLRHQFGGRLHADRLLLFKKFLREQIKNTAALQNLTPAARDAEAEARMEKTIGDLSQTGVVDPNWYFSMNEAIQMWRPANRINQRRSAIKSRWDKEKSKKILELPKPDECDVSKDKKCSLVPRKRKKDAGSYPEK